MLSRVAFLFIFLFAKIAFSQELTATQKFPEKFDAGKTYIIETKITKSNFTGFMRFAQELPDDFTAVGIETKGGSFTFSEKMAKIVWLTPPTEQEFTITYKITIPPDAKGKYIIRGKISYIIDNERKNYDLETIELRVGTTSTVKTETPTTETKTSNTPPTPTPTVTKTPTPVSAAPTAGKTYRVQIGAYSQKPKIEGVTEISTVVLENGITKYFSGNFDTYEEALKRKNEMVQKGFQGAFIVLFENGKIVK